MKPSLVTIFPFVALPLMAAEQTANWSGTIRCEIQVDGPGYHHQETQTWTLTGEPPTGAIPQYPAKWSVKGEGRLDPVDGKGQRARWTTEVEGMKALISFLVRQSDGVLIVRTAHSALRAPGAVKISVQQVAGAKEQPARDITLEAFEWALEPINADAKLTKLNGTLTLKPVRGWGPMQPPSAQVTAKMTWDFTKGGGEPPVASSKGSPAGTAQVVSLKPSSVPQGLTGAPAVIELTGGSTHWVLGKTSADFGPGILLYAPVNVISPEKAQAVIVVALDAALGSRPVKVTTGAEVATRADALTIIARGPRNLIEASPNAGLQDRTDLSVRLTGEETAFTPGFTTADFGAGISVSALTVQSPTKATAVLNIDPQASAGPRTIKLTTGSEVATLNGGFNVIAGPTLAIVPGIIGSLNFVSITQVSPASAIQGANNLTVRLTGSSTHFAAGTTRADFGAGVTVASLVVNSPTTATAVLNIASTATTGPHAVAVTTGSEVARLANGFAVSKAPSGLVTADLPTAADIVTLKQLTPNSGARRTTGLKVEIAGSYTQFVAGTTTVEFGSGITLAEPVTVTSATKASAVLNISADAAEGPRTVKVKTGSEVVTADNGFTVTASTAPLNAVNDQYTIAQNASLVSGAGNVASFSGFRVDPSGAVAEMVNVDGNLFFLASSGLWKSDGTPAGTTSIRAGSAKHLTRVNRTLFFSAGRGLWKSDGTAAGTTLIKEFGPTWGPPPRELTEANGTLFFVVEAVLPNESWNGQELWKTDGSAAGTVMLKAVNPGGYEGVSLMLTNASGLVYFVARSPGTDKCLWKSDGTAAGTAMITPITLPNPGNGEGMHPLTAVKGTLFFNSPRQLGPGFDPFSRVVDIWKSDGTAAGTTRLADITPNPPSSVIRVPSEFASRNGLLMFTLLDCVGVGIRELWQSDGTAAGTVKVKTDLNPGDHYPHLMFPTEAGGKLFFYALQGSGYGLWVSDGTQGGTVPLKTMSLPSVVFNQTFAPPLVNANGTLFIAAANGLWKSDGTAAGTVLVKAGYPDNLTSVNGGVFFTLDVVSESSSARELWIAGTAANLLANDSLAEGVTAVLGTGPTNGTLALRSDGGFTYRPNASFTGTDRFTYTVHDGSRTSNAATVTINVTAR